MTKSSWNTGAARGPAADRYREEARNREAMLSATPNRSPRRRRAAPMNTAHRAYLIEQALANKRRTGKAQPAKFAVRFGKPRFK